MNHKRKKPKNARAGCLMCKPQKANGQKTNVKLAPAVRRVLQEDRLNRILAVADDTETNYIEEAACRAGVWWRCRNEGCFGYVNPEETTTCENCGL